MAINRLLIRRILIHNLYRRLINKEANSHVESASFKDFIQGYLDPQAYLEAYPDVKSAGVDPVKHWLTHGIFERRSLFPDATIVIGEENVGQLTGPEWRHFTWYGNFVAIQIVDRAEERWPAQLSKEDSSIEDVSFAEFIQSYLDPQAYMDAYPDVRADGINPAKHWLEHGIFEGRSLFPAVTVVIGEENVGQLTGPEWRHFTWHGNPVAIQIVDQGEEHWPEMLPKEDSSIGDVSFAEFIQSYIDPQAYMDAYPDVKADGINPAKHWLEHGIFEGRSLFPNAEVVIGEKYVDRLGTKEWQRFTWRGDVVAVRVINPVKESLITQIIAQGRHERRFWHQGLWPSKIFDSSMQQTYLLGTV